MVSHQWQRNRRKKGRNLIKEKKIIEMSQLGVNRHKNEEKETRRIFLIKKLAKNAFKDSYLSIVDVE